MTKKWKTSFVLSLLSIMITITTFGSSTALFADSKDGAVEVNAKTVALQRTKAPNGIHVKSNSTERVTSTYKNTSSDSANLAVTLTLSESLPKDVTAYIDGNEIFKGKNKEVVNYNNLAKDASKEVSVEFRMAKPAKVGDHLDVNEFKLTQSVIAKDIKSNWVSKAISGVSTIKYGGEDIPGEFTKDKILINETGLTLDQAKKLSWYQVKADGSLTKVTFDTVDKMPGETIIRRIYPRSRSGSVENGANDKVLVYNKEADATYIPGAKYKIAASVDGLLGGTGMTGMPGFPGAPGELTGTQGVRGQPGFFKDGVVTVAVDPHIHTDEIKIVNEVSVEDTVYQGSLTTDLAESVTVYKNEYIAGNYVRTKLSKSEYTITHSNLSKSIESTIKIKGDTSNIVNYQMVYYSSKVNMHSPSGTDEKIIRINTTASAIGNKTGERETKIKYYYDGLPIKEYFESKGQKPIVEKFDKYSVRASDKHSGTARTGNIGPNGPAGPPVEVDVVVNTLGYNPTSSDATMKVGMSPTPPGIIAMDVMNGDKPGFAMRTSGTGNINNTYEIGRLGYWFKSKINSIKLEGVMGRPQLVVRTVKDGPLVIIDSDEDGNIDAAKLTGVEMKTLVELNDNQLNIISTPFVQPTVTIEGDALFTGTIELIDDYGRSVFKYDKITPADNYLVFPDTPYMVADLTNKTPNDMKIYNYLVTQAKGKLVLTGAQEGTIVEGDVVNGFTIKKENIVTRVKHLNMRTDPGKPFPDLKNFTLKVSHPTIDLKNASFEYGGELLKLTNGQVYYGKSAPAEVDIAKLPKGTVVEYALPPGQGYKPIRNKLYKFTVGEVDTFDIMVTKESIWNPEIPKT